MKSKIEEGICTIFRILVSFLFCWPDVLLARASQIMFVCVKCCFKYSDCSIYADFLGTISVLGSGELAIRSAVCTKAAAFKVLKISSGRTLRGV